MLNLFQANLKFSIFQLFNHNSVNRARSVGKYGVKVTENCESGVILSIMASNLILRRGRTR